MDIVPLILSESDVDKLTDDELVALAQASTAVIIKYVNLYFASSTGNTEIKERLQHAYSVRIAEQNLLDDEEMKEIVARVENINYFDIRPSVGKATLHQYKDDLDRVFANEQLTPYIMPIRGVDFLKIIEEKLESFKSTRQKTEEYYLWQKFNKYKTYFHDSRYAKARGTYAKRVLRNRDMYEIIRRGLDTLLKRMENDESPATWRFL